MNRAIGIILILLGIGTLVGSGYLFPDAVHRMDLGPSLLSGIDEVTTNWWPYIASILCFGGILFLLNSPGHIHRRVS